MRILTVTVQIIARMRIDDRIALMARLTVEFRAADVTHHTLSIVGRGRNAVTLRPHDIVVSGSEFFARKVTGFALAVDGAVGVTLHAVGHLREMTHGLIEISMTGIAFQSGFFDVPLMAEDGAVVSDVLEDEALPLLTQGNALVGDVFRRVAIGASRPERKQIVRASITLFDSGMTGDALHIGVQRVFEGGRKSAIRADQSELAIREGRGGERDSQYEQKTHHCSPLTAERK